MTNMERASEEWAEAEPVDEGADAEAGTAGPRRILPRLRIDAFAKSSDVLSAISAFAADRRAGRAEVTVVEGGFEEAITRYRDTLAADVTVIEYRDDDVSVEARIEELGAHCADDARLIVIGDANDVGLFRRLMKIGVSDYLIRPVAVGALIEAIADASDDEDEEDKLGSVIAFMGTRGGAGASTIAHNVAATIGARYEATSLLVDIDLEFGTAGMQFDVKGGFDFADALKEREALDRNILEDIVHWPNKHFGVLPAPRRPDALAEPSEGATRRVLDQARRLARYVTVDLPRGHRHWAQEALDVADEVCIVATPDLPSLRNGRAIVSALRKSRPNDKPPVLVLNRMPTAGEPLAPLSEFERILGVKIAAELPQTDAAPQAEMAGVLLSEEAPGSAAAHGIATLAARFVGKEVPPQPGSKGAGLGRLFRKKAK